MDEARAASAIALPGAKRKTMERSRIFQCHALDHYPLCYSHRTSTHLVNMILKKSGFDSITWGIVASLVVTDTSRWIEA